MLLFRLMHSGRDFVRLHERQDQLAFLDGHVRAFEPNFARPGEGHDKGGVESRGRGVRWQVLTPLPRGDSLDQISEKMQAEVDRLASERVWERFAQEGPLPAVAFEPRRMQPVSVNRSAMVRLEGACALDALSRWVLGAGALGGPQGHRLGRRLRGRLPARSGAGQPSPPAVWRPAGALPPLPRPALAQAAGVGRGAGRPPMTGSGPCWRTSAESMKQHALWRGSCRPLRNTVRSACGRRWSVDNQGL